jgi:hypothetical protein
VRGVVVRLIHLGALYVVVGALVVLAARRFASRGATSPVDLALGFIAWPLYAPILFAARPPPTDEAGRLLAVLAEVGPDLSSDVARWLPTPEQLAPLFDRLGLLDVRARRLAEVIARDPVAAPRLATMLEATRRERDELHAACARLRAELLVLRFADDAAPGEAVSELVADLLERVSAANVALRDPEVPDPAVSSCR